jgi:formylglycine-generating enzyme required for sulfatase activity
VSSPAVTPSPKVFISYSHDSAEHKARVLALSNRLRQHGIDCHIDQYEVSPPEGWPRWMERWIREADFVLIACTEIYARRFAGTAPAGEGLGAKFEGAVITQTLYDAEMRNVKFIPIAFSAADAAHRPEKLRGATYYRVDEALGYENLYRHVTKQPAVTKPDLGTLRHLPPQSPQPTVASLSAQFTNSLGMMFRLKSPQPTVASLSAQFTNSLGMMFRLIPAGSFLMGSSDDDVREAFANARLYNKDAKLEWFTREQPQHQVTFAQPFYMGAHQVTQAQWKAMMGDNPSHFKGDDLPVENVSWDDVQVFLIRLNRRNDGWKYRLPSEAEWEYACRAGTTTPFSFGDTITPAQVNYNGNYPFFGAQKGEYRAKTTPVGSFPPNAWGLHDMHGNVWEWCQDGWHDNYDGAPTDGRAWEQGYNNARVLRGGSWVGDAVSCRSALRSRFASSVRYGNLGLRVVVRAATN